MPNRLTLKPSRQLDQAAAPAERPARAPGQRQPPEGKRQRVDSGHLNVS